MKFETRCHVVLPLSGSDIGSVTAVDADSGMFGQIVYSVVEGADSSSFDVNRNTGEINIRNSLHEKVSFLMLVPFLIKLTKKSLYYAPCYSYTVRYLHC